MDLFGTAGIRGDSTDVVTPRLALTVGGAIGNEARRRGVTEAVLARDGRVTGPAIAAAMAAGMLSAGLHVRRAGPLPTPALAFASRGRLGVMITASHNPPGDNGIKLFADGVEFDDEAERRIEQSVEAGRTLSEWSSWEGANDIDVLVPYRTGVTEYVRTFGADLGELAIAVDCGNGTAALATPYVLRSLGGQVTALNANVDGHFPARGSKPTPESLDHFCEFVAHSPNDVGFAHDGDADRIVVVDASGGIVHEDTVVAILAERYVERSGSPSPHVVTTPNASARIDERVRAAGGRCSRVPLGSLHEGAARRRAAGDDVVFAAEPWKHLHPSFGGWIDGVVSAAIIARLVAEAGSIEELRDPIDERPYLKDDVACPGAAKAAVMETVRRTLPERFPDADAEFEHGVRLDLPDGSWLLVRPSGTEPLIRVYAESEDPSPLIRTAKEVVEEAVSVS